MALGTAAQAGAHDVPAGLRVFCLSANGHGVAIANVRHPFASHDSTIGAHGGGRTQAWLPLHLRAMADAWVAQTKNPTISALSFDERFALLVDAEHQTRDNRRLTKQ
jgi:hypothetical protein